MIALSNSGMHRSSKQRGKVMWNVCSTREADSIKGVGLPRFVFPLRLAIPGSHRACVAYN